MHVLLNSYDTFPVWYTYGKDTTWNISHDNGAAFLINLCDTLPYELDEENDKIWPSCSLEKNEMAISVLLNIGKVKFFKLYTLFWLLK